MDLPVLNGIIDRRILINYRVKPEIVKSLLPSHLEPLVVNGYASAGICLLRLKDIGVRYSPGFLRINSENAAHRFLVTFKKNGKVIKGVYIPRRDSDSLLNVILAGKIFSWPHYSAIFQSNERGNNYSVSMQSKDGHSRLNVNAEITDQFPSDSMFDSLEHVSGCFKDCPVGVSPSSAAGSFKTIELKTKSWSVKALQVHALSSNYFEDLSRFPSDSIQFDNALLMKGIEHEWVSGR